MLDYPSPEKGRVLDSTAKPRALGDEPKAKGAKSTRTRWSPPWSIAMCGTVSWGILSRWEGCLSFSRLTDRLQVRTNLYSRQDSLHSEWNKRATVNRSSRSGYPGLGLDESNHE